MGLLEDTGSVIEAVAGPEDSPAPDITVTSSSNQSLTQIIREEGIRSEDTSKVYPIGVAPARLITGIADIDLKEEREME